MCIVVAKAQQVLLPIEIENKWGFIDLNGKVIIAPQYETPINFYENGLAIIVKNKKFGLINQDGVEVIAPKYSELMWLNKGLLSFLNDSLWGVINLNEKIIVPAKYLEISYADNFIHCYTNQHHSIFDVSGKCIIQPTTNNLNLIDNYWYVTNGQFKTGLFDLSGNEVLPIENDSIKVINDSLFFCKIASGWNVKYKKKPQANLNFKSIKYLNGHLIEAYFENKKYALYDIEKQDFVSDKDFTSFKLVNNEIILGFKKHKVSCFKLNGEKLPFDGFDDVKPLGFELFSVKKNGKIGLVNSKGELKNAPEWNQILPFVYTVSTFQKDSLWGLINKKGEIIEPAQYSKIELTDGHARLFKKDIETVVRFNAEGEINASFNNANTIHIGTKKQHHDLSTHLRKVDPVYSTNCFALFHDGEAAGSLIHRDVIKQAFVLYNTCENEFIKGNIKLLDANLEDFGNSEVVSCIIEGGNFGILHKNGKVLTTIEVQQNGKPSHQHITYVGSFVEGLARVCVGGELIFNVKTDVLSGLTYYFDVANVKGGTWGFIDTKGVFVIAPNYQKVENFTYSTAVVQRDNLWGIINSKNETIVPIKYNSIERLQSTHDSLFVFSEHLKEKSYANLKGRILLPFNFEALGGITENIAVVKKNGKWGFVDIQTGRESAFEYDEARNFSDSLCAVKFNKKWGFINRKFELVIPNKFESISNFSHQLAFVKEQNHFEIINKKGEIVSDLKLKEVSDYEYGVAIAKKEDGYGLIDTKGKWIVAPKYHKISPFNKYKIAIAHVAPDKQVLMNIKAEHISIHQFEHIGEFSEGFALVKHHDKFGYIDTTGVLIIPALYDEAFVFSNGVAKVKINTETKSKIKTYSFINTKGEMLIKDIKYEHIENFSNELLLVHTKNNSFFVNKLGAVALELPNEDLKIESGFSEEKAIVYHKWTNRMFYIDKDGDKLYGKTFEKCFPFHNGVAIVKNDGKYGLLSEAGILLIDFKYDDIEAFKNQFSEISLVQKYGILDLKGKMLLDTEAERISVYKKIFRIDKGNSIKYMFKSGMWLN